jgi:hypothetical protein
MRPFIVAMWYFRAYKKQKLFGKVRFSGKNDCSVKAVEGQTSLFFSLILSNRIF